MTRLLGALPYHRKVAQASFGRKLSANFMNVLFLSRIQFALTIGLHDGVFKNGAKLQTTCRLVSRSRPKTPAPTLTTNTGTPLEDNQNSITTGARGPVLLQDYWLLEKLATFNPLGNYPIGVEKNTRSSNRIVGYSESDTSGANARKWSAGKAAESRGHAQLTRSYF